MEVREIQLKNAQEDATSYKSQVTSLQEYIKGINLVKESFDGSRVAGNTV
jgi:hypothetical protein|tara:strand:- start:205 stop:354 length:150 start_codon:yes stop_codon:yes gene_type:complete